MTPTTQQEAVTAALLPKLSCTRTEAAKVLGISANSLDRLVKRGLIAPSRALRRPLFSVMELERFLKETG
jgi:hypothetical protein